VSFLALDFWLAAALIATTAAVVLAFYLLKPPPERVRVPSNLIWSRILKDRRRRRENWRWWLSLLLALAIALSLAAAIGRPLIASFDEAPGKMVLVMDTSPTLGTRAPDGRTRWDHAVAQAESILEGAPAGSTFMLLDTSGQIASGAFEERDRARATLRRLQPSSGLEAAYPRVPAEDVETLFFSDGVLVAPEPDGTTGIVSARAPADNAGITRFEIRASPSDPERFQAFVELTNGSEEAKDTTLQVAGSGGRRWRKTFQIEPGASHGETIELEGFESGPLSATVTALDDDLDVDDRAYGYIPRGRAARVLLVSPGHPALEAALSILRGIEVRRVEPRQYSSVSADLLVFDGLAPVSAPSSPALFLGPTERDWLPSRRGPEKEDLALVPAEPHPLLGDVDCRDVVISRASWVDGGERALVAGTAEIPLILAVEGSARQVIVLFGLEASNFHLQAGFPVFLENAVSWLLGEQKEFRALPGEIRLPLPNAKITGLDGTPVETKSAPEGTYFQAYETGLYTAVQGRTRLQVAVNVLDRRISLVNRSTLPLEEASPAETAKGGGLELSPWLLLAAAVLVALEGYTYHRRTTV
jgi:hypothetical protein